MALAMYNIFSLIFFSMFVAVLLPLDLEAGSNPFRLDREAIGLNESGSEMGQSHTILSTAGQNTSIITSDTISGYVFQPDSQPYNFSYADWTEKWWQWAYSVPIGQNPSYDDTSEYCAENQQGPVWFLSQSYGHPVTRNCDIPANTALLATLLNSECSYAEYPTMTNEVELADCAKKQQDNVVSPMASINAVKIPNLESYRIQSGLFNITLPANNILNLPEQDTQAVSDGNWLFLKPLPVGTYELVLKGNLDGNISNNNISDTNSISNNAADQSSSSFEFAGPIGWNYTTTYILNVKDS
jgi:hypothetical protein